MGMLLWNKEVYIVHMNKRKIENTVKQSIKLRKAYIIRKIKVYMEIQHKKLPRK